MLEGLNRGNSFYICASKFSIMQDVFIVSVARTPVGSFGGVLSSLSTIQLGSTVVDAVVKRAGIPASAVDEVIMGNVCSANLGQAPARQAALNGGLSSSTVCTTVNKVCASGMKAISMAAQSIQLGQSEIVIAGGMESMSNIPFYVPNARWGMKYGNSELIDGLHKDGLMNIYDKLAMGVFSDQTAKKYAISREEQDAYAIGSYQKSTQATENGSFTNEIVPISIPQKKGEPLNVTKDEEYTKVDFSKIPALKPSFTNDWTATAANSSTLNDGASALLLMNAAKLKEYNLTPIARIVSYADAEQAPEWFTTTPCVVTPLALKRAGLQKEQISYFEINEAFAVVPLAFSKILELDPQKINIHGGAISLGHPIGSSGARIVCTLSQILKQNQAQYGLATICNGGGGGTAVIIERL